MLMDNPIFLALDVDDRETAIGLARSVKDYVGGFKIGPRLLMRYGGSLVRELQDLGAVFVDNKYFDIPNTVEHAIRATADAGAQFATVHASNGKVALRQLAELEAEINKTQPFKILVVTVLTSFNQENLPANWSREPLPVQVNMLAKMAMEAGLTGLVCSPHEVDMLRTEFPEAFIVTPGIRLPDSQKDDQQRVLGPREALRTGASALVIGRPIYQAADPVAAAEKIYRMLEVSESQ